MITDSDLRINYDFVTRFETLRKRHGFREMGDLALQELADEYGVPFETVRLWRHLRNALAHGDRVNSATLIDELQRLRLLTDHDPPLEPRTANQTQPPPETAQPSRAFRIHAWTDDRLEQEMLANGFISIGGAEIGDLTRVHDREAIRATLTHTMPERSARAIALFVGYWTRFLWEAQEGDLVALPLRDRTVALGELAGPYHFVADPDSRARHRRSIAWAARVDRDLLGTEAIKVLNSQHTVQEFPAGAVPELWKRASSSAAKRALDR